MASARATVRAAAAQCPLGPRAARYARERLAGVRAEHVFGWDADLPAAAAVRDGIWCQVLPVREPGIGMVSEEDYRQRVAEPVGEFFIPAAVQPSVSVWS